MSIFLLLYTCTNSNAKHITIRGSIKFPLDNFISMHIKLINIIQFVWNNSLYIETVTFDAISFQSNASCPLHSAKHQQTAALPKQKFDLFKDQRLTSNIARTWLVREHQSVSNRWRTSNDLHSALATCKHTYILVQNILSGCLVIQALLASGWLSATRNPLRATSHSFIFLTFHFANCFFWLRQNTVIATLSKEFQFSSNSAAVICISRFFKAVASICLVECRKCVSIEA